MINENNIVRMIFRGIKGTAVDFIIIDTAYKNKYVIIPEKGIRIWNDVYVPTFVTLVEIRETGNGKKRYYKLDEGELVTVLESLILDQLEKYVLNHVKRSTKNLYIPKHDIKLLYDVDNKTNKGVYMIRNIVMAKNKCSIDIDIDSAIYSTGNGDGALLNYLFFVDGNYNRLFVHSKFNGQRHTMLYKHENSNKKNMVNMVTRSLLATTIPPDLTHQSLFPTYTTLWRMVFDQTSFLPQ